MPIIRPCPPDELRRILEYSGYRLVHQDEFHFVLAKPDEKTRPILIPKDVTPEGAVAVEIMEAVLGEAKLDHYQYFAIRHALFDNGGEIKN